MSTCDGRNGVWSQSIFFEFIVSGVTQQQVMTNHKMWPQKGVAKMKGTREIRAQRSMEPQNGLVMKLLVMNFMFSKRKVHFQVSALISEKDYHYLFLFSSNILPLAPWLYSVSLPLSVIFSIFPWLIRSPPWC